MAGNVQTYMYEWRISSKLQYNILYASYGLVQNHLEWDCFPALHVQSSNIKSYLAVADSEMFFHNVLYDIRISCIVRHTLHIGHLSVCGYEHTLFCKDFNLAVWRMMRNCQYVYFHQVMQRYIAVLPYTGHKMHVHTYICNMSRYCWSMGKGKLMNVYRRGVVVLREDDGKYST